jgi:hypothetical protein
MINNFENFELLILKEIAKKSGKLEHVLSEQIEAIESCARTMTGVGIFSHFGLSQGCQTFPVDAVISPITLFIEKISFLSLPASVTLFFKDSKIDLLDTASCDEVWPQDGIPTGFNILWTD